MLNGLKNESEARNSLALEVVLESEAPAQEHRIRADILSGALFSIQNLVKHAYRKIVTKDNARELGINREAAPILDVAVPAAAGSFRMLLIPSNEYPNLFNASEVGRALEVVDYLLADAPNPEKTLRRVQEYSGHTASAFLRFLKFVNDSGSAISYSWAAPDRSGVSVRMLSHQDMLPLIDIMSKTENLGSEKNDAGGEIAKIDVDAGTWRLFSSEDGKEYSGKIRAGISLSHLETDENYVFECEEEVEEVSGTGRETIVIYLVKQPQMPRRH
jgi:hypothetical protein